MMFYEPQGQLPHDDPQKQGGGPDGAYRAESRAESLYKGENFLINGAFSRGKRQTAEKKPDEKERRTRRLFCFVPRVTAPRKAMP